MKKPTLAALAALAKGDLENFEVAITPGGIEAQEKRGQLEQAAKQTLPKGLNRKAFEAAGFVFGEDVDDLFVAAIFPDGWKKVPTDHEMWSDIVDDKGHRRGSIFYKAAVYDRSAYASLVSRFSVGRDYSQDGTEVTVRVKDIIGKVQHRTETMPTPRWGGGAKAEAADEKIKAADERMHKWLSENYPDWKNVNAYWD